MEEFCCEMHQKIAWAYSPLCPNNHKIYNCEVTGRPHRLMGKLCMDCGQWPEHTAITAFKNLEKTQHLNRQLGLL